jgi:2-polyprenyl-3-methyl-5-hydroxy-6-metoxy-1,4-benzoquinol methylase
LNTTKPDALVWTPEMVSRFWRWQLSHPEHYFTRRFGDLIARDLAPRLAAARTVLDLGCGPGFLIPHLAALGKEVTATDHSAAAVEAANARFSGLAGFRGAVPAPELLAEGRRFDAVVSIEVIEHLDDAQLADFLRGLPALLVPGGTAIVTTPNAEDLSAAESYCPCCDRVFHTWQHMRSWTAAGLAQAIRSGGLDVIESYTTDFSRTAWRDPIVALKRIVKRMLGRPDKLPHLVCVARRSG